MHELTAKVAPSTDFALCFRLRQVLVHADKPEQLTRLPLLSYDAVRFVRNHDTIMNEGFARVHDYHREHGNLLTLGWVLLLAMDGGTVLPAPRPFAPLHVALLICARCGRCWSTQTMPTGRSTAKSRWQLLRASAGRCCDVVRRHTSSSSCPCAARRYLPICVCVCVCVCVCTCARVHVYLQMIAHDCARHGGTLLARQQEPTKQGLALLLQVIERTQTLDLGVAHRLVPLPPLRTATNRLLGGGYLHGIVPALAQLPELAENVPEAPIEGVENGQRPQPRLGDIRQLKGAAWRRRPPQSARSLLWCMCH